MTLRKIVGYQSPNLHHTIGIMTEEMKAIEKKLARLEESDDVPLMVYLPDFEEESKR